MSTQSERALLASASLMSSAARSLDHFVEKLEGTVDDLSDVLSRLSDKIDSMGKGKSGGFGEGAKKAGSGVKDLASGLGELAKTLPTLIKGLIGFNKAKSDTFVGFVRGLSAAIGEQIKVGKDSIKTQYEEFSLAFTSIANGISKLSWGLFLFNTLTTDKGNAKFLDFIKGFAKNISELDFKKVKEGKEAIDSMSKGIALFGLTLALATPVFAIAAIGSLIIIPIVAGYAYLFAKLGDKEIVKSVDDGASALLHMGLGLAAFALGLFAVKEIAGGSWGEFAKGALIVGLGAMVFSELFALLGKEAKIIEDGSKSMIFVGIALASLALGIFVFQALGVGAGPILIAALAVAGIGLAFGIAGEFSTEIEEGSFAFMLTGIALASLALGIWVFQKMEIGVGDVLVVGLAVLTMGILFGLAGVVAFELIIPGAIAMGAVGLALIVFGFGFEKFKENKIDLTDIGNVSAAVLALGTIFTAAGVASWLILPGAAAMVVAGLALSSIAKGLIDFKQVNFTDDDAGMISKVIGSLATSFAKAGGTKGQTGGGLLGFFTGIDLSPNETKRGIDSVMDAGRALSSISKGLVEFKKLNLGDDPDLWLDVVKVVTGIGTAFASMGKGHSKKPGILGLIGVETTDTEMGIASVMGTGQALTSVAQGVKAFMKDTAGIDEEAFKESLTLVMAGISKAFSEVGGKSTSAGGILGVLGFDRNSVEDGINSVKNVGSTLVDLAKGVKDFANLTFTDPNDPKKQIKFKATDFALVGANIHQVLTVVSQAFGSIGNDSPPAAFGGLFGAADPFVKKGIDAVKGVGKELIDLATGVKNFANLTFTDPNDPKKQIQFKDKDFDLVGINIGKVLTVISHAFGSIGNNTAKAAFGGLFGAGDPVVKKGIDAVKGVGKELLDIANSIKIFASFEDIDTIESNIQSIISTVPQAFLAAYTKNIAVYTDTVQGKIKSFNTLLSGFINVLKDVPDDADKRSASVVSFFESMADSADPITRLAVSFDKIANSINKFSTAFKRMDPLALKNSDMLFQSMTVLSKVDPNAFDKLQDKGKQLLNFIFEKGANKEKLATTSPVPPVVENNQPGTKPAWAPPTPPAIKGGDNTALIQKLDTTLNQFSDTMAAMGSALKDIKMLLQGTLKVQQQ